MGSIWIARQTSHERGKQNSKKLSIFGGSDGLLYQDHQDQLFPLVYWQQQNFRNCMPREKNICNIYNIIEIFTLHMQRERESYVKKNPMAKKPFGYKPKF